VPVVVSPKLQLKVNGPTPPVVVAVNVTETPTSGDAGAKVKAAADNRAATTTEVVPEAALEALLSVTVTAARNVPAAA
jgi:hypothetical protein